MNRKVYWRSWCRTEAFIELKNIKHLPLQHEWLDGYTSGHWNLDDIWLTTNGLEYLYGANLPQVSWFAESYQYAKSEYDIYETDRKFALRFHFNPNFCKQYNTVQLPIFCWWKKEFPLFEQTVKAKHPEFTFGMILGRKPPKNDKHPYQFGWMREEVVKAGKNRSFKYYGQGWSPEDKNYAGETYVNGNRNTPVRFNDARILMTKAKFVFVIENIHDPFYSVNYMTEKIFHGFLSASVPIYGGAWNIEEIINPNLFIDMRKFNFDIPKIMTFCEKMPESEYQGYLDRIGEFLIKQGTTFSGENVFLVLDKALCQI